MELPIYEGFFEEDFDSLELAIVDEPAIEKNFNYFSKDTIKKMTFDNDKMIITGPAMIPNQLIYRNSGGYEYYIYFSEESIRKFAEKLLSKKGERKFNIQHSNEELECNIIESYFAPDNNEYEVPKGSWIVSLRIKYIYTWEKIKNGEYKGFSIEGIVSSVLVEFKNNLKIDKEKMDLKEKLMSAINAVLFSEQAPEPVVEPVVEDVVNEEEVAVEEVIEVDQKAEFKAQMETVVAMFSTKLEEVTSKMNEMENKLVAMSNEPVTQSVTEEVSNTLIDKFSKAAEYFKK